ncbi:hypothetical protein NUITMVS1_02870 [Shewanella xiamenensis]|nr:hypothetical protein NUITMVS1_02870 [Shewanella xiamenensis]BDQ64460.1 hypothetical protein NUITMVS2_02720 [Shewanella xiamenensis]GLD77265.1 hypothetical protein NUITMVS3_16960 [Shewanella xiamenensis]
MANRPAFKGDNVFIILTSIIQLHVVKIRNSDDPFKSRITFDDNSLKPHM